MMLIFLIMGMFMDWVGIVLLIMPVFLPIVLEAAGRGDRLFRRVASRAMSRSGSAWCSV